MSVLLLVFVLFLRANYNTESSHTIVIFGGNGFVGRAIAQESIARSYRVIVVSRSGCPNEYKQESWVKKVEWFQADALKPKTYTKYITDQKPDAILTMMGVLNVWKQITQNASIIEKYTATTNINVCKMGSNIDSVEKFVFIGADAKSHGVTVNDYRHLWSTFMYGQTISKINVEKCVKETYGSNGISFRPTMIAGIENKEIFGYKYKMNRLPFYEYNFMKIIYKFIDANVIETVNIAVDVLNFIEDKDVKFECENSKFDDKSRKSNVKLLMQNMDNLIIILLSILITLVVYVLTGCM